MPSYRLIDIAGGGSAVVVDLYDDEFGQEGGVAATLAVDEG
jgi:hypothetical protein